MSIIRKTAFRALTILLVAGCAPLAACVGAEDPTQQSLGLDSFTAPDAPVVLISVDTLRADRLPAYGYEGVETPAIDTLAADGLLFESAWAHAPTTLPSHASLLTGLLPGDHGIRDNLGYELDPGTPTLAGWLAAAGYQTAAAVSAFPLRAATGLDAGFELYEDELTLSAGAGVGEIQRRGPQTLKAVRGWIEADPALPFLFLHLFEPHLPWSPPPDIAARYGNSYEAEVAAADRVVGELLELLRTVGLYDRSLVIFLSDHGEGLGDHGEQEHGILLHREVLRVPLIVKLPASEGAGTRISEPAQLVDVFPTVTGVLGRPPPEGLPGRSLLQLAAGRVEPRSLYAETWMPRLHLGWSELYSLVEYPWHYIHGPSPELYDLSSDPGELHDLAEQASHSARIDEMAARVAEFQVEADVPAQVDAATRRRLAALGYLGGGGVGGDEVLEDPKAQLPVLAELKRAARLVYEERFAEAVVAYRELLDGNPELLVGWEYLARAERALGRLGRAVEALERLRELSPDYPETDIRLAEMYAELGRLDAAAPAAEAATDRHPARAAAVLAGIAIQRGDVVEAERQARIAIEADPGQADGWVALAEALLQTQTRLEEALAAADRALEAARADSDPTAPRGLHVLRGRILAVAGRLEKAEEAFRAEVERFSDNLAAWSYLAGTAVALHGPDAGLQVLERMLEANPGPAAEAEAIRTLRDLGAAAQARERLRRALQEYPGDPQLLALQR